MRLKSIDKILLSTVLLLACEKQSLEYNKGQSSASPTAKTQAITAFSSVIIDARGLGVSASMSPTIVVAGKEVFPPPGQLDMQRIIDTGLAAYVYGTPADAGRSSRAGKTPLLIRARAAQGRAGVQLSPADGEKLLAADRKTGLLKQFKVIFLLDKDRQ